MTVGDLKKILSDLPLACDDFKVEFVDCVTRIDNTQFSRQDRPVFGSLLDEHSKEFLLAGTDQYKQLEVYAKQKPNQGCHPTQHFSAGNAQERR